MSEVQIGVTYAKSGEPIASAIGAIEVPKACLRVNSKGTVYFYLTVPVVVTDDAGNRIVRTMAAGSLILRAAPILE